MRSFLPESFRGGCSFGASCGLLRLRAGLSRMARLRESCVRTPLRLAKMPCRLIGSGLGLRGIMYRGPGQGQLRLIQPAVTVAAQTCD